jgi:hypothetical protein
MHDNMIVKEERPLTDAEFRLVTWLVIHGGADAAPYATQLRDLKVVSRCNCGCPTIDLAVGDRTSPTTGSATTIAEAFGLSPEGVRVGVYLHVREGQLSELSVFRLDDPKPFTLPTPETLEAR